jgi:hypothetical protein
VFSREWTNTPLSRGAANRLGSIGLCALIAASVAGFGVDRFVGEQLARPALSLDLSAWHWLGAIRIGIQTLDFPAPEPAPVVIPKLVLRRHAVNWVHKHAVAVARSHAAIVVLPPPRVSPVSHVSMRAILDQDLLAYSKAAPDRGGDAPPPKEQRVSALPAPRGENQASTDELARMRNLHAILRGQLVSALKSFKRPSAKPLPAVAEEVEAPIVITQAAPSRPTQQRQQSRALSRTKAEAIQVVSTRPTPSRPATAPLVIQPIVVTRPAIAPPTRTAPVVIQIPVAVVAEAPPPAKPAPAATVAAASVVAAAEPPKPPPPPPVIAPPPPKPALPAPREAPSAPKAPVVSMAPIAEVSPPPLSTLP